MKLKVFIIALLLSACSTQSIIVSDGGKIITASQLPTSFNESMKMQIETTEYIFIVEGNHSIKKGSEVEIVKGDYLGDCLRIKGDDLNCWLILK